MLHSLLAGYFAGPVYAGLDETVVMSSEFDVGESELDSGLEPGLVPGKPGSAQRAVEKAEYTVDRAKVWHHPVVWTNLGVDIGMLVRSSDPWSEGPTMYTVITVPPYPSVDVRKKNGAQPPEARIRPPAQPTVQCPLQRTRCEQPSLGQASRLERKQRPGLFHRTTRGPGVWLVPKKRDERDVRVTLRP